MAVTLKDYFRGREEEEKLLSNKTKEEVKKFRTIQKMLNTFEDEADALKWLDFRRRSKLAKRFDRDVLGIEESAEVQPPTVSKRNIYYNPYKLKIPKIDTGDSEIFGDDGRNNQFVVDHLTKISKIQKEDAEKRGEVKNLFKYENDIEFAKEKDRTGKSRDLRFYKTSEEKDSKTGLTFQKFDRNDNGKVKKKNIFERSAIRIGDFAFATKESSNWSGRSVRFFIMHSKAILSTVLFILILYVVMYISIYIAGIFDSFGRTPFALCNDDGNEIYGVNSAQAEKLSAEDLETVNKMATKDYALSAFIGVAKQRGWSKNATIGAVAYFRQEGSGMGTFTYESYYNSPGPGGDIKDKTLNNKKWLSWLNGNGIKEARKRYKHGWAIGLGLSQESDVDDGTRNATKMIEEAEAKGAFWQDPQFQIDYVITKIENSTDPDLANMDFSAKGISAKEWCDRITAGIGMPGWNHTDDRKGMRDHSRWIDEAKALVESGGDGQSLSLNGLSQGGGVCDGGSLGGLADGNYGHGQFANPRGLGDFDGSQVNGGIGGTGDFHGQMLSFRGDVHQGIDMPGSEGDPIYAADDGIVAWASKDLFGGNGIIIQHGPKLFTFYWHMHNGKGGTLVKPGMKVKRGQKIGEVGKTGLASGAHLHFEVHEGSNDMFDVKYARDPKKYLQSKGKSKKE